MKKIRNSIMNRIAAAIICGAAAVTAAGCGSVTGSASAPETETKTRIVCAGFAEYDWTRNILGSRMENAEVTYLLGKGTDMHSYQPTAADMVKISGCDLFVYTGGESEKWADDAAKEAVNPDQTTVKLLDILAEQNGAYVEEIKEGMQSEEEGHDHDHEHEHEDEEEEDEAPEYDEHVWLTPENAELFCGKICEGLKKADPDGAQEYDANLAEYLAKLERLEKEYDEALSPFRGKTIIVADRFPFRYLAERYGIDYCAAFSGCSAETEASFETVAFLSGKVDELGVGTVFTLENSDGKLAQAVIDNTAAKNAQTAKLDSLQSVSEEQAAGGTDYISVMKENLSALEKALEY